MNLINYYWYFQSAIPERICDDIVKYGHQLQHQMAVTGGYGDGKKLIDTFAKNARVKVKHMMGGFEVYGDPISQNRFLNSVVNSKPLLKYLYTK